MKTAWIHAKVDGIEKRFFLEKDEAERVFKKLADKEVERIMIGTSIFPKRDIGEFHRMTDSEIQKANQKSYEKKSLPKGKDAMDYVVDAAYNMLLSATMEHDQKKRAAIVADCIVRFGYCNSQFQAVRVFHNCFKRGNERFIEFHSNFIKQHGTENIFSVFNNFDFLEE